MKRIGNIYDAVISVENLQIADKRARKGKMASYGVRKHDRNREANILALHEALRTKSYRTSEYSVFIIFEPKKREIYRLPYIDRIVHHAIMNIIEPIWVSVFTKNTYSCIKGRGIHRALQDIKNDMKNDEAGTTYFLKLDVKQFYPSIDHTILKTLIRKKIKDRDLLCLLDEIIDSAPGVPIGNYLSQYFANLYLAYFDHWVKEAKDVRYYYRYADDIVILSGDKTLLHSLRRDIQAYLWENLKLEVKGNYAVRPVEAQGLDFVGYVIRHTHVRLRKSIKKAFARKVAKGAPKEILAAYYGWTKHCDARNLLKKLDANGDTSL